MDPVPLESGSGYTLDGCYQGTEVRLLSNVVGYGGQDPASCLVLCKLSAFFLFN